MNADSPKSHYDIVVVGGGMVGATFACALSKALAETPISILVVEAVAPTSSSLGANMQPSFDARSTALSYGSSEILQAMGLWQELKDNVSAIKEIHVSDRGHFGSSWLSAEDHQLDALGYVVENRELGVVLNQAMTDSKTIDFLAPATITEIQPTAQGMQLKIDCAGVEVVSDAALVVLADGGRSPICNQLGIGQKVESYEQYAMISNIAFETPHKNIAYERFTDTGPLAVLPLPTLKDEDGVFHNRGSLVWTLTKQQAQDYQAMADAELLPLLQQRFGNRLGKMLKIGERFCYPLSLTVANEQHRPGLVLLGNVAHNLHPVAGQGLNLSLRDCLALVEILSAAIREGDSPGAMSVLQRYQEQRQADQEKTIGFTHEITKLFSSTNAAKRWLRKFGLISIDLVPPIKRGFAEQAMGLSGN